MNTYVTALNKPTVNLPTPMQAQLSPNVFGVVNQAVIAVLECAQTAWF